MAHTGAGGQCTVALDIAATHASSAPSPARFRGQELLVAAPQHFTVQESKEPRPTAAPTLMPGTAAFSTSRVTRMKPRRLSPPGSVMIVSRFLHKGAEERD